MPIFTFPTVNIDTRDWFDCCQSFCAWRVRTRGIPLIGELEKFLHLQYTKCIRIAVSAILPLFGGNPKPKSDACGGFVMTAGFTPQSLVVSV